MDFNFPGWHLMGSFPINYEDGVGSWILEHGGEALLLEIPPGLSITRISDKLAEVEAHLKYVTASHSHEDHLHTWVWRNLPKYFPTVKMLAPSWVEADQEIHLGGEPVWLVKAPKHSRTDVVVIFRGVAMTGDVELGTLDSVNDEVPSWRKRSSMQWLAGFEERRGYKVHTVVSAHLNDVRRNVNWPELFEVQPCKT